MALVHEAHFELNDFSEWTNSDLSVDITTVAPGLNSTSYKCQLTYDTGSTSHHAYEFMLALFDMDTATEIRVGCRWRPNGLLFAGAVNRFAFFEMESSPSALFQIRVVDGGSGTYNIIAVVGEDSTTTTLTATVTVADLSENTVELHLVKASSAVANDGEAYLYVNGSLEASDTTLDMFNVWNDADASGRRYRIFPMNTFAIGGTDPGGGVDVDDVIFRDDSTQIFPPTIAADDEFTIAPIPKPCDVNSDGDFIYLAALNSLGFPVLIQFATALNADGSIVFEPGAGDNIGVECSRVDADEITVAGQFDSTNVIERSEDAGVSFSVIDDGSTGGVSAFRVGPDRDDRILVFDEDNSDLLETIDAGTNWTTINASVSQAIKVIGRLAIDVQQAVFGNSSADAATVTHSMSSGRDIEELTGGDDPNSVDVTGVIIN